jgi:hypothetical protein
MTLFCYFDQNGFETFMRKKKSTGLFLLLISVFPLLLMGGGLFFCCRSSGFSVDKIASKLRYNQVWEIEPITESQRELLVQKIFPQTFYYLAAGNQCYAFVSEDGEYILKFFKMQHLFPKGWLQDFPFSLLKHFGFKHAPGETLFLERIFANYKDAYETLREETGLIYIHLNKTSEFKAKIFLIDSKGRRSVVDLDSVEFIAQKRAVKIFDHFQALLGQNKREDLRASMRSFLQLIALRCEKGFVDQSLSVRNNFGFVGNTAVQFDCATLTRDASMKYPSNFRKEILEAARRLDVWAKENSPEITLFVQEEAQRLINQSSY